MNDGTTWGIEDRRPVPAGFLIKNVLMPNFQLSVGRIAEIMETGSDRVARILRGDEKLTTDDARHLKKRFGTAADSLMRVQEMGEFFDRNGRRPNQSEKAKIFSQLTI